MDGLTMSGLRLLRASRGRSAITKEYLNELADAYLPAGWTERSARLPLYTDFRNFLRCSSGGSNENLALMTPLDSRRSGAADVAVTLEIWAQ